MAPVRSPLMLRSPLHFALAALVLAALAGPALAPAAHAQGRDDLPPFLLDRAYWSSRAYEKKAVMNGNQVGITFFNYGLLAGVGELRGNWPLGSNDFYVGDVLPIVAAEVPVPVDDNGDGVADRTQIIRHVVSTRGPGNRGINVDPQNASIAWTFEPKPGFASNRPVPQDDGTVSPNDRVALSTDPNTWPGFWPDEPTWIDPATGQAQWNGYFGRNQFAADLESYFWADDNNDREVQRTYPLFRPDSILTDRGGLGLEMKVRGLQWSQFLAQDAVFWLYEVTNNSTTTYPRVAVGLAVGTLAGGDGDSQDDLAFFDQANRIVYSYDNDNRGNQGQPVGYVGYGFLESPGNPDNGIDDDGDGDPNTPAGLDVFGNPFVRMDAGTNNTFNASDFVPRVLAAGDPIVSIDNATGQRTIQYVPASGTLDVVSQGRTVTVQAGQTLQEATVSIRSQSGTNQIVVAKDLVDDDLDGLIDEDPQLHFERRSEDINNPGVPVVLPPLRYANYAGFAAAIRNRTATRQDSSDYGLLNPMIDEDRANGIDEDGDWTLDDDVGNDGVAGTGDPGEGNGRPDDGEPNFDRLDVDESDQIGLSSFYYFAPSNVYPLNNDNTVWDGMTPGFFTTNQELIDQQAGGGVDGDFVFGSGYFRLEPGETLRFTLALVFGEDLADITNNQITIQEIYDRNYQFARPPDRPTLRAVPGDGQVTLYWDSRAEASIDPILGQDFQGYRLFKSTDPFFRDSRQVTDVTGNAALRVPIVQFDRNDGIQGVYTSSDPRVRGVPFNLGDDTGLRYSYVDTDVDNGQRYYYALTAYDSGSPDFYPAENDFPVTLRDDGNVTTGQNVVEVTPNAGAAGFVAGGVTQVIARTQGGATGEVFTETLDPRLVPEGAQYTVRFNTAVPGDPATPLVADSFFVERNGTLVGAGLISDAASVVFDGIRLAFNNDRLRVDQDSSGYLGPDSAAVASARVTRTNLTAPTWRLSGVDVPYDYEIRFLPGETSLSIGGFRVGTGVLAPTAVARLTNVEVFNRTLNCSSTDPACPTKFVFLDRDNSGTNTFTFNGTSLNSDNIIIYEDLDGDPATEREPTYFFRLNATQPPGGTPTIDGRVPTGGDTYLIATRKPFTRFDQFTFGTTASRVDATAADDQMDRIRVVPNPYVAAASWERGLPPTITSGRGERRIDFIHLPAGARVRIFNVRGALVRELVHDGALDDGTVSWDLRTRENLETAYGVYFYHVESPSGATRTGRLALIK